MSITLARVVNEQTLPQGLSRDGSILLDKIDKSQGHSESPPYAQITKQKIYVPYVNPADPTVKGYVDLVQTDEVLLSLETDGSIGGLAGTTPPRVSVTLFSSALIATPVITSGTNTTSTTIGGTTFLSVLPDLTYVEFESPGGLTQLVSQAAFSAHLATSIVVPDAAVTIGSVIPGWKVRVFANSKFSNQFTLA